MAAGDSWTLTSYPSSPDDLLAYVQTSTGRILAGAANGGEGIVYSDDDGVTWQTGTALPAGRDARDFARGSSGWIYAVDVVNIYASDDDGDSWTSILNTNPFSGTGDTIWLFHMIVHSSGDLIVLGYQRDSTDNYFTSVLRSQDGGTNWTEVYRDSGTFFQPNSLQHYFMESNTGRIFRYTYGDVSSNEVAYSDDRGATWASSGGGTGTQARDLVYEAVTGYLWGVATGNTFIFSSDDGATWSSDSISGPTSDVDYERIGVSNNGRLIALIKNPTFQADHGFQYSDPTPGSNAFRGERTTWTHDALVADTLHEAVFFPADSSRFLLYVTDGSLFYSNQSIPAPVGLAVNTDASPPLGSWTPKDWG